MPLKRILILAAFMAAFLLPAFGQGNIGVANSIIPSTVANLPSAAGNRNVVRRITDPLTASDCSVGGGSYNTSIVICVSNGTSWLSAGGFSGTINLTSQVTGILPVANGGTNSNLGILVCTQGTITLNTPCRSSTVTWNAGGVTFENDTDNVTDSASAAASTVLNRKVNSVSVFKVDKSGNVTGTTFTSGGAGGTIQMTRSSGGVFTIDAADTASNFTGTFPAATGTVLLSTNTTALTSAATFNATAAAHTSPVKSGALGSIPATCTFTAGSAMEMYLATDATAGQNLYFCTATNTWTQQLNSGGGGSTATVFDKYASYSGAGITVGTINVTKCSAFVTGTAVSFSNIGIRQVAGDGGSGALTDVGILDSTGALVAHIGAQSMNGANGFVGHSVVSAPKTLTAATRYYFCETSTSTAFSTGLVTGSSVFSPLVITQFSGTTSGGALNGSNTPPADSPNAGNVFGFLLY